MLIKKSAPQPAIKKTPTGGTSYSHGLRIQQGCGRGERSQNRVMMMMRRAETGFTSAIVAEA